MKRILRVLTAVLTGLILSAGSAAADIPTAVFTNVPSQSADLQIRKEVVSSVSGYGGSPDTLFCFHVVRNGSAFRNQEYTVTDANGDRVQRYDTDYPAVSIPWTTDGNGDFYLKDGWTAVFEWFGSGAEYEVSELNIPDGYRQIQPASGTKLSGMLGPEGSILAFVNAYTPPAEKEYTQLTVMKQLSFPTGYEKPATSEFSFQIKIDGKLFRNEEFTLTDADGIFLRSGETDENGCLTLQADEKAEFYELEPGMEYIVSELQDTRWRVLGSEQQAGVLQGRSTDLIFTNCLASFGVKKELLSGNSADRRFPFQLSQANGTPMGGVSYYLYDGTELSSPEPTATDDDGRFFLKAEQTAIFTGVEPDVTFHIRELQTDGWRSVIPSTDGITGKTDESTVRMYRFVNEPLPDDRTLYVTKQVTGIRAGEEDRFTLILEKQSKSTASGDKASDETDGQEPYAAVCGAVFSIQEGADGELQYTTDSVNGSFQLHGGQTAVFKNLEPGVYRVRESGMPRGYDFLQDESVTEGTLDKQSLYLTVTNHHSPESPRTGSIRIRKKDAEGKPIEGAEFQLTRSSDNTVTALESTGSDGEAAFTDLTPDIYVLTETKTEEGKSLLKEPVTIALPLTMTEEEAEAAGADTSAGNYDSTTGRWYFYDLRYEITNHAVLSMPEAGGRGGRWTGAAGTGLVLIFLLLRRRKRRAYE